MIETHEHAAASRKSGVVLRHCIHCEPVNCPFQFKKRGQYVIRANNGPLSVVAMRVCNPDRSPVESIAETQPQLKPALPRLSAMISHYFTAPRYPTRRASQPLPHFLERLDARDIRGSPDHLVPFCQHEQLSSHIG